MASPHEPVESVTALITEDTAQDVSSTMDHASKNDELSDGPSLECQSFVDDSQIIISSQDSVLRNNSSETEQQSLEEHSLIEHSFEDLNNSTVLKMNGDNDRHITGFIKNIVVWLLTIPKILYIRIIGAINFLKSLSAATVLLWAIHMLEWVTIISLNVFITNYVGSVVYNGVADADPNSESFRNYSKGIRMGFVCQSIEFGSSFIFSLLFKKIISIIRLRELCIVIHVLTFISCGLLVVFHNIYLVTSLFVIIGWFFALIQIIPFIIIQQYKVHYITE